MRRPSGPFPNRWSAKATFPLVLAIACACALPSHAGAQAQPGPQIANLQVVGGEESWHADNAFTLSWDQASGSSSYLRAVIYRLYDSSGKLVVGPVRNTQAVLAIELLEVPPVPGVYTAEIWLEDVEGGVGPPAYATLRFDDVAPAPPLLVAPAGWLLGNDEAPLEIDAPAEPMPLSAIVGYAISLDAGGGSPCARPTWCSVGEVDLPLGTDTIDLGPLPEGTTYARVVSVSGSGVASAPATVPLRVDATAPQLTLHGVPDGWSSGPVRLTALAADWLSGMVANGLDGPFTAIAVDGGAPAFSFGDSASTWVSGSGVHQVSYFARDAAGNVNDGVLGPSPLSATVPIDEEPPQLLFAATQDPAEPERIEATVSDSLSGPSSDRGSIALRQAGTHAPFEELPTQVVDGRLIAHWDSDSYPPGKYEFRASGYDNAGNVGTGSERARGAKMVLVNPLKTPTALEAGFGGPVLVWQDCSRSRKGRRCHQRRTAGFNRRPAARIVPFGHGIRFSGRLESIYGGPLGGREIEVTETFAGSAAPAQRTTLLRTEADGTFSLQLLPGPSREVTASFAGSPTLSRTSARSVHLGVLAAVNLHASAATAKVGGAPIVFSGRVDQTAAARAKKGLPVELEFRYPGADWSEFRTVEADARGRFRYAYRFSDDDSRGIRFQFRAYVIGREGWPYEPAYSRPIAVTGR